MANSFTFSQPEELPDCLLIEEQINDQLLINLRIFLKIGIWSFDKYCGYLYLVLMQKGEGQQQKIRHFNFPESKDDFETIAGLQDIKVRLKIHESLFEKTKITDIYNFKEERQRAHKIIAICRYCRKDPSKLVWTKKLVSDDHYRLTKFVNAHEHAIQKQEVHGKILKLLEKSYAKLPINELADYCIRNFDVTAEQFRLIKEQMLKKKTFIDDLEQFRSNNYLTMVPEKLKIDPQTSTVVHFPSFLFASSREMVIDFMQYGKVIFLHRYPFLIKKTSKNPVDYFILVISGIDEYANIVFFGFSIVSAATPEIVAETLLNLFQRAPRNKCQAIFTQNQQFFTDGVELFRQKTKCEVVHLWDLLLEMKEQDFQKRDVFKKCMSSCTSQQFSKTINEYQKLRPGESLKLEIFRKRSPKFCLSQIPAVFIGLGPPLTHCDDIMKAILKNFPKELEYNRFVFRFFEFLSSRLQRYPPHMVKNIEMPLLKDCRGVISQQAYNYTLANLLSCIEINITTLVQNNQLKINDHVVKIIYKHDPQDEDGFTSRQSKVQLKCNCYLKQKTGVPCCHIIRTCMHFGIPVSSQVDQMWKTQHRTNLMDELVKYESNGEKSVKMEYQSVLQ